VSSLIWISWPDIYYCLTVTVLFCGALSLRRGRVCLLYILLALARAVFLGSESLWTRDHILLSQIWDLNFCRLLRLAGSGWRYSTPPPHGFNLSYNGSSLYRLRTDHVENTTHMIATQPAHWRADCCLAKNCNIRPLKQFTLLRVATFLLSSCPEMGYINPLFYCCLLLLFSTAVSVTQPFLHGVYMPE
jgi:hypothetical protein